MKTYEEFIKEAYEAKHNIDEGVGSVLRTAGRAIPVVGSAISLGVAAHRLSKGNKRGAVLAAGSAIPGPIGNAFLGAEILDQIQQNRKSQNAAKPKPAAPKSPGSSATPSKPAATPSKPAATPSQPAKPVLSKLGGVEGTGVGKDFVATKGGWKSGEKERYQKYSK